MTRELFLKGRIARRKFSLLMPIFLSSCATPGSDGSVSLFNGRDLTGWTMLGKGSAEVEDGVLWVRGGTGEKACLCYSGRTFGDFTLVVEWTAADMEADSGIFLRIPAPATLIEGARPRSGDAVKGCYEVQIHDGSKAVTRTGWVVDVWTGEMSDGRAAKPPGTWNRFEITALGQEYTVVLNGVTTHRFTGDKETEGCIGIQSLDRESSVGFRKIEVLPAPAYPSGSRVLTLAHKRHGSTTDQ